MVVVVVVVLRCGVVARKVAVWWRAGEKVRERLFVFMWRWTPLFSSGRAGQGEDDERRKERLSVCLLSGKVRSNGRSDSLGEAG